MIKIRFTNTFIYYAATKAKALFDFLYYKRNITNNLKYEILEGLRINWLAFEKAELKEFETYVKHSESRKMEKISQIINKEIFNVK